ncbi:MAG: hypothetical protein RMX68_012085 [Aulosira sp. ZfuVER01]|nr:hypothetical protein [Aulosira sp. ZfuVER01]MDZ7999323.1 hypothetical protein [Aulosira sp. DedVER01a]MDZ8051896.1 hypothetical protein [Aulosira sp. ZfuCHP01]
MTFKQTLVLASASIAISLANVNLSVVAKEANIYSFPSSQSQHILANFNDLNYVKNLNFSSVKSVNTNTEISYYQSKDWFFLSLDIGEKKQHQCEKKKSFLLMDLYNFLARLLIVISFGSWGLGGYFSVIEGYVKRIPKNFLLSLYLIFGLLSLLVISSAFLSTFAFAYPISNSSCLL